MKFSTVLHQKMKFSTFLHQKLKFSTFLHQKMKFSTFFDQELKFSTLFAPENEIFHVFAPKNEIPKNGLGASSMSVGMPAFTFGEVGEMHMRKVLKFIEYCFANCCVLRDLIQLSSQRIDLNRLRRVKSEEWVRLSMLLVVVVAADHEHFDLEGEQCLCQFQGEASFPNCGRASDAHHRNLCHHAVAPVLQSCIGHSESTL